MVKKNGTILLADPDVAVVKELNKALKAQGWEMVNVKDGTRALELAISRSPDFIIMEIDLPFLNGVKVAQILKSNPDLKDVPIIFMSSGDINPAYLPFFENAVLKKPFNVEEVITRLNSGLVKMEKAMEVQVEAKEIEGSLSQMSLVDILQIFGMNKKSGVIVVRQEDIGVEGMIFLEEGEVVSATVGAAKGEKALYRLLTWESGKFEYMPQNFHPDVSIAKSTDSLLMEGMRQLDEWKRMSSEFPPMDANIYLKIDSKKIPSKLRPVTREVIALLEFYKAIKDVIDNSTHSDFETMMTIHTLVSKGVLGLRAPEARKEKRKFPLLTSEEAFAIKEGLRLTFRESSEMDVVKIPILTVNSAHIKTIANLLVKIEGFIMERDVLMGRDNDILLGSLGSLKASDNITLLFQLFPADESYFPLWASLMGNTVGAVLLRGKEQDDVIKTASQHLKEALHIKPLIMNLEKEAGDLKGVDIPQMNLWEIGKEDADKALHGFLSSFLNLS